MTTDQLPGHCDIGNFKEAARQYKELYLYIGAAGCEPCTEMKPFLAEIEQASKIPVVEIEAGECPNIVEELDVNVFPTMLKMKKGKVVSRHEGVTPALLEKLKGGA